jgi:protein-tyrosine phosphatase
MFQSIILVCTGNICRSPIAEALLKHRLADTGIAVGSAGTVALVDYGADAYAQQVVKENGLDISRHKARQATRSLLAESELILSLDQSHSDWIRMCYPELYGRVHKLGRWRKEMDIVDPFRRPKAAFEQSYADISKCVDDWVKRIHQL